MKTTTALFAAIFLLIMTISGCRQSSPSGGGRGPGSGRSGSQVMGLDESRGAVRVNTSSGILHVDIATGRASTREVRFDPPSLNIAYYQPEGVASPDKSYTAAVRLAKDEHGDEASYVVLIKDVRDNKEQTLAKSRITYPEVLWLDNQTLAYTVLNKYQVPNLYVINVQTGKRRLLCSNPEFGALQPVGYWRAGKIILFQTSPDPLVRLPYHDTLWSVGMDGRIVKLAKLWEPFNPASEQQKGKPQPAALKPASGRPSR